MAAIRIYMREIEKFGRISAKDEIELAEMIASGTDEERDFAINELVTSNLKLVIKIANDYTRDKSVDIEDIIAQGNIGLIKAAQKFKSGCGAKFSTHASWWIKQSIKRYLDSKDMIRIPSAYNQKIKKVFRIKGDFETSHGREPSAQELSKLTGFSEKELEKIKQRKRGVVSLDVEIGDEGSLHDVIASNSETYWTPEKELLMKRVLDIINKLSDNEKYIIVNRFGLDGAKPKKLEEISAVIGKTAERVRQIQNNALKKIRNIINREE